MSSKLHLLAKRHERSSTPYLQQSTPIPRPSFSLPTFQIIHNLDHILDLPQALSHHLHNMTIIRPHKTTNDILPLSNHRNIRTRSQEPLSKEISTLGSPCIIHDPKQTESFLATAASALHVCVGVGFVFKYLERDDGVLVDKPGSILALFWLGIGTRKTNMVSRRLNHPKELTCNTPP